MEIYLANKGQIDEIEQLFCGARSYMRACGNTQQWVNGYPSRELLLNDIAKRQLYIMENNGLQGSFAFIMGDDPTYAKIDGSWLCNSPYGTVHRLASAGKMRGIAGACFDFCLSKVNHLRVDTHSDNAPMQAAVTRYGFSRRGIIYLQDGSPRVAFELLR